MSETLSVNKEIRETPDYLSTEGETGRLMALREVLKINTFFQHLINLSKEPIQVLQPVFEDGEIVDFTFHFTNSAYALYAESTPEALKGKRVSEFFPGYFQTSSFVDVARIFKSGGSDTWEIHYNLDGLDLYNKMTAVKMDDYVVVLFTDFSELKRLQLQLVRKIDELEHSNKNLEEVAHAASHDLKEPIRKVSVFVSRLKEQMQDRITAKEVMMVEKIENAVERMSNLIDDLLAFSSMSQVSLEKEAIDLNVDLQKVLEDLELHIEEKKAIVELGPLPVISGYKRQVQQMFQNLIGNALKYTAAGSVPRVSITAGEEKIDGRRYHAIFIQDNGIGFEQRYAEKIFQLFTRLNSRSEYSGTGIGLAIVKKVVDNHEGKISVDSKPGAGSTFRVLFPL